jgi:hypothetical protein
MALLQVCLPSNTAIWDRLFIMRGTRSEIGSVFHVHILENSKKEHFIAFVNTHSTVRALVPGTIYR